MFSFTNYKTEIKTLKFDNIRVNKTESNQLTNQSI